MPKASFNFIYSCSLSGTKLSNLLSLSVSLSFSLSVHTHIYHRNHRQIMIGAQLYHRTVSGFWTATDQANAGRSISNSFVYSSNRLSFQLGFERRHFRKSKSILVYCMSSRGSFDGKIRNNNEERDHEYLEAVVLLPETIRHYRMRMQGFQEDMAWQSSSQSLPFSVQAKDPRAQVSSIGLAFLRRFQNPTIFLKISCEGDFLLPIIVGEFAVERLIDSSTEDGDGDSPNQFQLVRNLVGKLGYEVKMVRITERVVNTYFARIFFCKPGENEILSVDARPSDAINVAKICKAPIYVNKQVVLSDAIRIAYGMGRARDAKCIYDVILDSAADGPDLLLEELNLVRNLNLAVKEERYSDAAMMREKLTRLRESKHEL